MPFGNQRQVQPWERFRHLQEMLVGTCLQIWEFNIISYSISSKYRQLFKIMLETLIPISTEA